MAEILLYHTNGTVDEHAPAGTTDRDRGVMLVSVLDMAAPGETVIVPPGGYKLVIGETATRDGVRVHLKTGVSVYKDSLKSQQGPVVRVSSGEHRLSGFGEIANRNIPVNPGEGADGIVVEGGRLSCTLDSVQSSAPSDSALVCRGGSGGGGRLVYSGRSILSREYDGLEVGEAGNCTVMAQSAISQQTMAASDGNAIEIRTSHSFDGGEASVVRAESRTSRALNLNTLGGFTLKCQSVVCDEQIAVEMAGGFNKIQVDSCKTNLNAVVIQMAAPNSSLSCIVAHQVAIRPACELTFFCMINVDRILVNDPGMGDIDGAICILPNPAGADFMSIVDVGSIWNVETSNAALFSDEPNTVVAVVRNYRSLSATANVSFAPKNHP